MTERKKKYPIGHIFQSKKYGPYEITKRWSEFSEKRKRNIHWAEIKFHKTGGIKKYTINQLTIGSLRDDEAPNLYGKGIYLIKDHRENPREYQLWQNMMRRCYGPHQYYSSIKESKRPYVEKRWIKFSNFLKDLPFIPGYEMFIKKENVHFDKDIFNRSNTKKKVYSRKTCQFVNAKENISFSSSVVVISIKTNKKYKSIALAAREEGVDRSTIYKHIEGKVKNPRWTKIKK